MGVSIEELVKNQEEIYVFGYGSLTWKPDFEYDNVVLGYIKGYERRFWQGSTHHRGSPQKPGRVLTLTKVEDGICWGAVFEVKGKDKINAALDHLGMREQSIGCYDMCIVPVYVKDSDKVLYSIVYYATPKNDLFLGDGSVNELATDIATCCGKVGHNIEYLFRLTDFMREHLPEVEEEHLYALDSMVRRKIGLSSKNTTRWELLTKFQHFQSIIYQNEGPVVYARRNSVPMSPSNLLASC